MTASHHDAHGAAHGHTADESIPHGTFGSYVTGFIL